LPTGPVLSFQGTLDNPIVQSINHLNPLAYPGAAKDPLIANASFKLSKSPLEQLRRAPLLGEHNGIILEELGYSVEQIEALIAAKII
jgi:crotonobetainyl-CoA:carnitine CoA-transferase CaiB-like acyl-CoA transferase